VSIQLHIDTCPTYEMLLYHFLWLLRSRLACGTCCLCVCVCVRHAFYSRIWRPTTL